jgi:agmatine/peptidylarginine deiminase
VETYTNQYSDRRHTIVIAAPAANNDYYQEVYSQIIAFDIDYAQSIIGKDNVVILGDKKALELLEKELPNDILLRGQMRDIWMRDFTTINPTNPIQFRYAAAAQGGPQRDADWVQMGFVKFTDNLGINYPYIDLILDGGNVVDNHKDKVIVTDRFLEDNHLNYSQAKTRLKKQLNLASVAIIPTDDPEGLAHADGMVMFIDDNTVVINRYDEPFRNHMIQELTSSFPNLKIVEIDADFDQEVWDAQFSSACGIHVNSLVTPNFIYMPVFGTALDQEIIKTIQANSSKQVVPINAENVCFMGGSVRCLGWQISGEAAKKVINAARVQ